jgi:hypothetical protein
MKLRVSGYELELDDDWVLTDDLVPIVAHDSHGAELIISVVVIEGQGSEVARDAVRARVLENAFVSARGAAAHPELAVVVPLSRSDQKNGIELWVLIARTHDEATLFAQAIWVQAGAVGVLTLESPNTEAALARFDRMRDSIRPLS